MQYRQVGNSGLRISAVSIGGWLTIGGTVDYGLSRRLLHAAYDGGVNFIDLADVYATGEAEKATATFLKEFRHCEGRDRSNLVISSKVFWPMSDGPNDRGLSRKHILESCDKSLQRLGTDYLDIYFCHRFDPETPVEETARAMDHLVRSGKVLYWGTSCWTAEQLTNVTEICDKLGLYRPIVEQPRYNLIDRDIERDGVRDAAQELGMGLVVWSPLAQGMLTGKYNGGVPDDSRGGTSEWLDRVINDETLQKVREFSSVAEDLGTTPAALALTWLTHQPGITSVITGATKVEQVEANLAAAQLELDQSTLDKVASLFPHPAVEE